MVLGGEVSAIDAPVPDEPSALQNFGPSTTFALDVIVRWGDWVLSAHELSPPRTFVAAEQNGDVTLPAEILGAPRLPILVARWDDDIRLVVPKNGRVFIGGQKKRMSAARCISRGLGQPSSTIPDAAEVAILPGQTVTLFLQTIVIEVRKSLPAVRPPPARLFDKRLALAQFGSLLVHAFVLFIFFFLRPIHGGDDEGISDDQKFEIQQFLNRSYEREMETDYDLIREGYLRRARRNERRLQGFLEAELEDRMRSIDMGGQGWTDQLDADARRNEAPRGVEPAVLGALYDWPTPEAPPPKTPPVGRDNRPVSVTLPADPQPSFSRGPKVRMGAVSVNGRLPPEVIQRIVRQNFGRFRLCYENGLRNNPNLQGRVGVRFLIGRDGAVTNVSNGGSDMPDGGVVSCVVRAFSGLSFPQPEAGIVSVVYPIMFSPGD